MAEETNVQAAEVQGDSNTVGSKVVYKGRKMTVINVNITHTGDRRLKLVNLSGISALAKMLKVNTVLQDLTYVASPHTRPGRLFE